MKITAKNLILLLALLAVPLAFYTGHSRGRRDRPLLPCLGKAKKLLRAGRGLPKSKTDKAGAIQDIPPLKPGKGSASIKGEPSFDPANLSPELKVWYYRLLESIVAGKKYIAYNANSGNSYRMRVINEYVSSMAAALRATGDLRFLDEAARVMELARAQLRDAHTLPDPSMRGKNKCSGAADGFLGWLQLAEYPKGKYDINYPYFCTDNDPLDEPMAHGGVALFAYTLHMNRQFKPLYGELADFWTDYLENHFLAKWAQRKGGAREAWSGIERRFTHPTANLVRIAYYLHRITGKKLYLERARHYASMLVNHVAVNPEAPGAFVWKHNIWGSDTGYQKINYAQYFLTMAIEMATEGFGDYYPDQAMAKFAGTFRDVVFKKGEPKYKIMALRVNGEGSVPMNVYNVSAFARWDPSGYILKVAEKTYRTGNYMTAAYALLALSPRVYGSQE